MVKECFSLALILALLHAGTIPAFGRPQAVDDAELVVKIKGDILKRGLGKEARVKVQLKDGTEVRGSVDHAGEDDFVVADGKGSQRTIVYGDVARVKGRGLPIAAKIGIGIAAGVGVVFAIAYIQFKSGGLLD